MDGQSEKLKGFSSVLQVNGNQIQVPDLIDEEGNVAFAQFEAIQGSPNGQHFSIEINQMDEDAAVSFGVSQLPELRDESDDEDDEDTGTSSSSKKRRETDGLGYFSDTGRIVSCLRTGNSYHRGKYKKGSSIGVQGDYITDKKSVILFFRDGKPIHRQWVSLPPADLFPTLNVWWGTTELTFQRTSPLQLEQTNLSCWLTDETMVVTDDRLELNGDVEMAPSTTVAPHPLNDDYFEIKIERAGQLSSGSIPVVIGLTSAEVRSHTIPGTVMESLGYHGDEGKVYHEDSEKTHNLGDNCKCVTGDTMGCGVFYFEVKDPRHGQKVAVYFTKNGKHVFHKTVNQPNGGFYPTVTIKHAGDIVSVNMTAARPSMDFETWKKEFSKGGGAFSDLPKFTMPDQGKTQNLEDDDLEGITVQEYRFAEEIGGMKTNGTVTPSQQLKKPRMIQCTNTLNRVMPDFTVAISDLGYDSSVCVGITRSSQTVGTLPGHLSETVGYDCQGRIFQGARHKTAYMDVEEYGKGDTVGCHLEYSGDVHILSFTKNGRLMGRGQVSNSNKNDLMPSIGFKYMPSTVRPKWPHKPAQPLTFEQGDLDSWIKTHRLSVSGNVITVRKKARKTEPQMFTAPHPLTKDRSYFALKVLARKSQKKGPTIGISNISHVSSRSSNYRDIRFYSHHNDIITKGLSKKPTKEHLDVPAGLTNDTVGCGVVFAESDQPDDRAKQFVIVVLHSQWYRGVTSDPRATGRRLLSGGHLANLW
ncbi:uncharacterized protein [Ptychodera flava]|uniref:uncharacterized protein n=1 Tax=Ptychodera flava TaxID=63121 RepID=UPI003969FF1D